MLDKFKGLLIEEEGQGMTEYGLILGLIAVAVITVLTAMGTTLSGTFDGIVKKLPGAQ
ncbi:Flp family type IVb pilin [Siminovitchia sediminis]|uniref:Flp family type IVb pilin n=1 Tax=Siminovitchia sediminis TaxID=1274353 RepID=A0ABW4KI42_9BACI